jgi:hypothetical protein
MRTRALYYRFGNPPSPNVRFHDVEFERLGQPESLLELVAPLGLEQTASGAKVPKEVMDGLTISHHSQAEREQLAARLVDCNFAPRELISQYVKAGRRLA